MLILEMDWTLFWTALSGIGGLAAVITIIIAITNNRKKKRNTLMQTCNDLCEAMSIGNINTLLNKIFIICDRGMPETSANIEIHNHLERIVKEVQAKWKEMRQQLQSSKQRNMLAQMEAIVEEYHYCFRDVETIVRVLGSPNLNDITNLISEENSQEMRDIISTTSQLNYDVPGFAKQLISLRFKDLEIPNYAAKIHGIFNDQHKGDSLFSIRLQAFSGDCFAQYALGKYYDEQKQYKKAFGWYKKAAEQGNVMAQYNLGVLCQNGAGTEKNEEEAFKWYKKAAEQGNVMAQFNLGVLYQEGTGTEKNEEEAFKWFKKAAEQGSATAQYNLGVLCQNGAGTEKDKEEAFKWYKKAAEQGDIMAQFNLGTYYQNGAGTEKNEEEAFKWFKKAAEQGDEMAQFNLGMCYHLGMGTEKDKEEAFKWFKKAAEQGDIMAQLHLGLYYHEGTGTEKDDEEAFKWVKKSAEQGYAAAQFNLGLYYQMGTGCTQDYNQAFHWFSMASQHKEDIDVYNRAIYSVGGMYLNGTIGFGSPITAIKYIGIAAQNGYPPAQCTLGFYYEIGIGQKEPDIEKAKYWYGEAAKQGDKEAIDALNRLKSIRKKSV